MEIRDPSSQGVVSPGDGGSWIKIDPVTDHTSNHGTDEEKPETEVKPLPAEITLFCSVMIDEDAGATFIPPSSSKAPLLPEEGSMDAVFNNPTVTLTNWAADATEAKANPNGLDRHDGDKQLMAVHNKVYEVKASTAQTSRESMDTVALDTTIPDDVTLRKDQNQTYMEHIGSQIETCYDPSPGHLSEITTGAEESKTIPEDILRGGRENWRNTVEEDDHLKQVYSVTEENSENETHFDQNWREAATNQLQVPEIPETLSSEENVDTRSLDYNLTTCNWVRRESGSSETEPKLPISEGFEEILTRVKLEDESRRISTDIQQGEQLLQRLQQVQLRQDVLILESHHTSEEVVQDKRNNIKGSVGSEVEGDLAHGNDYEGGKMNLEVREKKEKNESTTVPVESEHHLIARTEPGDFTSDHLSGRCIPAEFSLVDHHETPIQIPLSSTHHRFSAAETIIEKQIHKAAQEKQNLQRSGGFFNLADNPDVLEIPFKTNISLDTTTVTQPYQHSNSQFSEQKMQKEISQEIQRELILVNQGKIPGRYSKGEIRQLKETKLLFEVFQQYNMEGPTRHRKSPTLMRKGNIYPSVLERTCSLERFSLKSHPISRAPSLRQYKSNSDVHISSPGLRSKSPTVGVQDKTCVFQSPKQDKIMCLHRSMDSISTHSANVETGKTKEGKTTQGSPILKQNPFYKLRPALALQPEVEKDIREAKEREEELRRQRCTLYGENRQKTEDGERSQCTATFEPG